jgi:hypothetical protein
MGAKVTGCLFQDAAKIGPFFVPEPISRASDVQRIVSDLTRRRNERVAVLLTSPGSETGNQIYVCAAVAVVMIAGLVRSPPRVRSLR